MINFENKSKKAAFILFFSVALSSSVYAQPAGVPDKVPRIGANDNYTEEVSPSRDRTPVGDSGHYIVSYTAQELADDGTGFLGWGQIIEDADGTDLFVLENSSSSAGTLYILSENFEIYGISYNYDVNRSATAAEVMNGDLKVIAKDSNTDITGAKPVLTDYGDFCVIQLNGICYDADGNVIEDLDKYLEKRGKTSADGILYRHYDGIKAEPWKFNNGSKTQPVDLPKNPAFHVITYITAAVVTVIIVLAVVCYIFKKHRKKTKNI